MALTLSPQGLRLIRRFEHFAATPYLCPAGVWTVGYGHAIRSGEHFARPLTEAEAEALLARDARRAERAVYTYVHTGLSQGQLDALVSFTFNLGAGALERSTLRRKVNRGAHAEVPEELMKWIWAGGRRLRGLIRRRRAEGALYAASFSNAGIMPSAAR